jgi:putative sporulation protein YtaF
VLESLLLVTALIIDSFIASVAYGAKNIKIPLLSALIIDIIGTLFLVVAILASSYIKQFIPYETCKIIGFLMLLLIGVSSLFQGILKTYLRKKRDGLKKLDFKIGSFRFVFDIYLEETLADSDKSKILSANEAIYLAIALSIDSLAIGLGSGLFMIHYFELISISLILGLLAVLIGCLLGRKFAKLTQKDVSWISGAILILLAILRL